MLFDICSSVNPNTKFISEINEIESGWLLNIDSVGICGATSTPKQLLEEVASYLKHLKTTGKI